MADLSKKMHRISVLHPITSFVALSLNILQLWLSGHRCFGVIPSLPSLHCKWGPLVGEMELPTQMATGFISGADDCEEE